MRQFDALDTHSFQAFWTASQTLNFTAAARTAGLTQSGVSQHVSRLERQLGVPLFRRINKRVFLTEAGKLLRAHVDRYLDQTDSLRERISAEVASLTGTVAYAMPASCLMSPHFDMLLEKRAACFPELKLDVTLCPSDEVVEKLLANEAHFGFVTKRVNAPGIELIPFCFENYVLVSASRTALKNLSPATLVGQRFVEYPGADVLFEHWRAHRYPRVRSLTWDSLEIAGRMNSLPGAIDMARGGVGLAVVPEHCVAEPLRRRSLFAASGAPTRNQIYIAQPKESPAPRRVQTVIDAFLEMVSGNNR